MQLREAVWMSVLLALTLGCSTPSDTDAPATGGDTSASGASTGGATAGTSIASGGAATVQGTSSPSVSTSASATGAAGSSGGNAGETGETSRGSTSGTNASSSTTGSVTVPPVDCRSDGDGLTTLVFVNRCAAAVLVRGSDISDVSVTPGGFVCVDIGSATQELSSKRYWGFTGDDPGAEHHTLAEFTFNTDFNDFDWYNISHVDAFNLPMQIVPVERPDCDTLTCAEDLLLGCPDVGRFENEDEELVACVSPDRDSGESPVAIYFESCDDAYAWSGDDQNGDDPSPVRACAGEDWDIVFCPEGAE
ncbi:MAG TPA: thaumatin family protein [Polyangiaceae bacterium]|nr:thaumatin family protein [Polyangiaceae bacterium]